MEQGDMGQTNPEVDAIFDKDGAWRDELRALRAILLDCGLTEELKWGKPCYTFGGGNVAILYALKDCAAVGLFKGALLGDPGGILRKPGENSQSSRWIRFAGLAEIGAMEPVLRSFLLDAIEVERSGLKVDFKAKRELVYPEELQEQFGRNPALKAAFEALTPGRRRGYNLHFTAARQSATRTARIEKCIPRILQGKGMNDR